MTTATTNPKTRTPAATKRAFVYLRVSSEGQVNTDYDRDGLSIAAQREAAEDKAGKLDAEIVREFTDPGKSAFVDLHKRVSFLEMLDELRRCNQHDATRVDYVIVWALNRWARNTVDHWQTRDLVRQAGARLISITEPMAGEDTAAGFLYEGIVVTYNQYQSMLTGESVKRGLQQKAKGGGTYGPARLGYRNVVEELPDGRRVNSVALDDARHHFITLGFQLYDSGEYSLSQLVDEAYRLGLRSRRGDKVDISAWHRMLRNPYYAGMVVYKRDTPDEQWFQGRHEALIDQDTFDRVQTRLGEQRRSGERGRLKGHYLKGTVYCGSCGRRMTFAKSRGKSGKRYGYFYCVSRVNGGACDMRTNVRPQLIEDALLRYYREAVELPAAEIRKRTAAIKELVAVSQGAVVQVREAKTALIAKLEAQQVRLLRLYAEEGDAASPGAFRAERERLQTEIEAANRSLAETELRMQLDADHLRMALELAEDIAAFYESADEQTRRHLNQAFFRRVYVTPEWDYEQATTTASVVGADLTEPYAVLLEAGLTDGVSAEITAIRTAKTREDGPGEPSSAGCSYFVKMAEREGFEPSRGIAPP